MLRSTLVALALAAASLTSPSFAQTLLEQAAEHRYQLDFRVNDAALAKMLPAGWEAVIATQGPAKDANLRMIFIDRMAIMGGDGKPAARPTARLVYLAIPVKQTAGGGAGQTSIQPPTRQPAHAPGAFRVAPHTNPAKMPRRAGATSGAISRCGH